MGRGTLFDTPCPVCHGTGTEQKVRSRQGPHPGRGRGRPAHQGQGARRARAGHGARPATSTWSSTWRKHPVFGRSGRNLTITVPITFPEAALGTTITVPTLDGKVTLKVPPGTSSGKVLRVRGRGVPGGSGRNGKKPGDLLVKIEVVVPTELTDEQRAARGVAGRGDRGGAADRGGRVSGRAWRAASVGDGGMADRDANQAVYVISVAAELTGMHPQTLRIYERKGLLDPSRTSGGSRRFSERDLERLRHIQELTSTGLNLEGVRRVLQLESELARLREELVAGAGPGPRRRGGHAPPVPARPGAAAPVAGALPAPDRHGELNEGYRTTTDRRQTNEDDARHEKDEPVPIDPERWTNNTKAAFSAATGHAASSNHPGADAGPPARRAAAAAGDA